MTQTNEAAFETVIETHLLANGYELWMGTVSIAGGRPSPRAC
jgi:hypothetical protein